MEEGMYGVQYHHPSVVNFGEQGQGMSMSMRGGDDDDLHALIAHIPPPHQQPPCSSYGSSTSSSGRNQQQQMQLLGTAAGVGGGGGGGGGGDHRIKAMIAAHPNYPRLLDAYIDCQKVGAPPEIASLLDEIRRENDTSYNSNAATSGILGADPELDLFMDTYCDLLAKYKSDLARPFDEATTFLNTMEVQLSDLCKGGSSRTCATSADDVSGSSEDELSGGEMEMQESHVRDEDRDIKEKLLRKYSGYLSSLKQEFSKKKKKGKLPKEARQTLLDWWNVHYKWPYPTEADKIALAESTGLDQKQINNWFINQRKRHWKPSESMQFAVMDSLSAPYYG